MAERREGGREGAREGGRLINMYTVKGGAGGRELRKRERERVCDCIVCRYGHEWVHKHTTNS